MIPVICYRQGGKIKVRNYTSDYKDGVLEETYIFDKGNTNNFWVNGVDFVHFIYIKC